MPDSARPAIRKARRMDFDAICRLDAVAGSEQARCDRIERGVDDGEIWVATLGDRIAGYGLLSCSFFGQPFIELVMIDPAFRNQGLGPELMRQLESVCGGPRLFTSTNASNRHMQHVLEKLGFQRSGIVHNLDPGDPEVIYFKAPGK